jgi:ornithine carbamoyltransferase
MNQILPAPPIVPGPASDLDALDSLEATVSSLRADALAGASPMPLNGRRIGVLCEDPLRPEVFLLQRTASELGARVALVQPGLDEAAAQLVGERTGRVLGRLYDALICVDVPAMIVRILRDAAGIPAAADLAGQWIALRSRRPDEREDERYLLQALVIEACA